MITVPLRSLILLFALILGGCSIKPIVAGTKMCGFSSYELKVEQPPNFGDAASASGHRAFGDVLDETLFRRVLGDEGRPSESMLFLSGGSLHGAFGAGFLDEWKRRSPGGHLPDFKVVTGVSTGSILSTFAFVDQPERAVEGYTITNESELLKPFGGVKNGDPTISSYVQLLKKGALADLGPLRLRLHGFIDDGMLHKVATEGARGRLLLVGVVDVDTGQAVILDLTDMAKQYVSAPDDATRQVKRDCYIEAIMASSSAPLAALPVFIDNRMYVDGGVRFGMFSDEIGEQILRTSDSSAKPTIYLLISGDQEVAAKCGKADPAYCSNGADPPGNHTGAHAKWTFPELALRSEGILANQVYRFSADRVAQQARARGIPFRQIVIKPDMVTHSFPRGATGVAANDAKTCQEWRAIDRADGDPLQFYPKYMRCVIDYGRARVTDEMQSWTTENGPF
jgi:hypothetical protein